MSTLINQWHRPADVVAAFLVVGGVHDPGRLADHPHGARAGTSGTATANTGPRPGCGWRFPVLAASPRPAWRLFAAEHRPGRAGDQHHDYFWAGTSLIVIAGYLATVAGVWLFGLAARRRDA